MYYENGMTITMRDSNTATKALELMKERLAIGFEIDKIYRRNPSERMIEELYIEENRILIPEECGYHCPEDAEEIFVELLKAVAEGMKEESFVCSIWNNCDVSYSEIEAEYANGIMRTKTTYYPSGYLDEEFMEDLEEEEVEEYIPVVTEKEINIK